MQCLTSLVASALMFILWCCEGSQLYKGVKVLYVMFGMISYYQGVVTPIDPVQTPATVVKILDRLF